jgi:hypothetical protein
MPPQRDRSCAEKHTERDTSRVTYKFTYEAPDVSRPILASRPRMTKKETLVLLGRAQRDPRIAKGPIRPETICLDFGKISCHSRTS